jgi:PAS domain S-box-containing protein
MKTLCFVVLELFLFNSIASPSPPSGTREIKRVLILYSEDRDHPAHELTDQGIRSAFESNQLYDVQLYTEYLDVTHFGKPSDARAMADFLRSKYLGMNLDVLIAVYPYALDFLLAERSSLFPGVPIVGVGISRSDYGVDGELSQARRFVTGIVIGGDVIGLMDVALRLKPATRRVALVAGTAPTDAQSEEVFRKSLEHYAGKIDLIDLTKLPLEETLSRVRSLPPDALVLYSSILRDGAGKTFVSRQALSTLAHATNAPVFSLYDSYLGFGIVGGRLVSFRKHGIEAGKMALRILHGTPPASIPISGEDDYISAYDWRELKRWNIPEAALPPGSEVRYRTPSFWEDHRDAVIGTVGLIVIETSLIFGLLVSIRRRRKAEGSLAESEEQVRLAVSSAGAGLWGIDLETGYVWATDRAREIFGFAPQEPLDFERVLSAIHEEDRERVRMASQNAAGSGDETILEYRVVPPGHGVRWVAARGRLQRSPPGVPKRLTGVCIDITESKIAEETIRQHEEELATLAGRLIHAREEELRRISRDLHDDLTQRLAVLAIDAGMLEKELRPLQPQASTELQAMKNNLIQASEEVHDLSRQLHPSILDDLGLVQAIESECDAFSRRTGIDVSFEPGNDEVAISPDAAVCLYRVLQEGLQNISKHSGASEARVVLQEFPDEVRLLIQDPGIGFDIKRATGKGAIGLSSMRERVRLVGGRLSVVSEPARGTRIQVSIPLRGNHAEAARPDR